MCIRDRLKGLQKINLLEDVVSEIYNVRKDLGFVPLVTPASQIIGAQALSNILNKKYEALSVEIIDLALGYYGKLPGELDNLLLDKAKTNKKKITQRPADLLNEKFTDYQKDLSMFCKKLDINDLSSIEEHVLTFILIPYGSEELFRSLNS